MTWTVTDGAGNTATCTQMITVTDDEFPTISCPGDVVTTTSTDDTGDCDVAVTGIAPLTSNDNCSGTAIT